jgi:hypothetical protein
MANQNRRFSYHAHAVPLQGEVTYPFQEKIGPHAPTAVSPFGGFEVGQADPFSLRDTITHRGARSQSEGGLNPATNEHYAVALTVVEGLNLSEVVTVDRIVARLVAVCPESQEDAGISPSGSYIENLRIAGHRIELRSLAGTYHTLDTMEKVREHYRSNSNFRDTFHTDAFVGKEAALPEKVCRFFPWRRHQSNGQLPEYRGHAIVPLFQVVDPKAPGIDVYGNVIHIHHFGRLHIGELFISRDERRLTMIHADLGSPQQGNLSGGSVCGGISPSDPP